jgi:hypothetical protein
MAVDTDGQVLMEFRAAAAELKPQVDYVNATKGQRIKQLSGFVGPYLKRLADLGWPQQERILTLVKIWDEIE